MMVFGTYLPITAALCRKCFCCGYPNFHEADFYPATHFNPQGFGSQLHEGDPSAAG